MSSRAGRVVDGLHLDDARATLERELARRERPTGFTDDSIVVLLEKQSQFVEDLGLAAIRQARRARADVVSAADVERAEEIVSAGSGGRRAIRLEALGGILAGAGLGEFIDVLSDKDPTALGIALPPVLMVIGAIVVTAALLRR